MTRLYQRKFTKEGHEVLTAENGATGLKIMEKDKPDLLLLDLMLPGMSGLEVLERIKANPATVSIPVIILTNLAGEKEQEQALELGAVTYIIKSEQDTAEVAAKVDEVLTASTRDKDLPQAVSL